MASSLSNISVRDLKKAITLRERIEALERRLAAILGETTPAANGRRGGNHTMSAAGRARIAAAQRRRWAKQRKGRRKMSAAAKAKISAVAKARWAKVKAKGGRTLAG